ncbi:MAG: hypothetical protein IRY92_13145 [Dactylosporangium sp.]|nr:hypothetical protein [Dactylosporangium sp.]
MARRVTVAELLAELARRGATVEVVGGQVCVRPKSALTDELREALREHKDAVVAYLQKKADGPAARPTWRDCTPQEAQEEAAAYAERGWAAIFSEALQEAIILARNEEAARKAPKGLVTYTEPEVATLAPLSPEELRRVHAVKRCFGGRAVELRDVG